MAHQDALSAKPLKKTKAAEADLPAGRGIKDEEMKRCFEGNTISKVS
jgi:hypothetical protein